MAGPSATIDPARAQPARPEGVPAIRASAISKRYGHLEALRDATLELHPGEVVALVGDNGAGKSTLTKVICGAVAADGGELSFWGEPTNVLSIQHAHELGVQPCLQQASCEVLACPAGKWRCVDTDGHRNRRLIDGDQGQRPGICRIRKRLPNRDLRDTSDRDDVTGSR